jgi:peptidoglycan/xylan/chitin deacetylase (PgdA/CDA1 family)
VDVTDEDFRAAVEAEHGAKASLFYVAHVIEAGPEDWNRRVHVFDLEGHPTATRAYAWVFPPACGNASRIQTALHLDGMRGPHDAVKFTLANRQTR